MNEAERRSSRALDERLRDLEWLLFDVDGVLTDGRLWYTAEGEELKAFHARDGLALKLAQRAGLKVGVFSGRTSRPLERRAQELGLDEIILASKDKRLDFAAFLERTSCDPSRVAFTGDDLIDLPALARCGVGFCPRDAAVEVRSVVDHVVEMDGGHGVARAVVEKVLRARGQWRDIVASYAAP